jgi:hypothetical protein
MLAGAGDIRFASGLLVAKLLPDVKARHGQQADYTRRIRHAALRSPRLPSNLPANDQARTKATLIRTGNLRAVQLCTVRYWHQLDGAVEAGRKLMSRQSCLCSARSIVELGREQSCGIAILSLALPWCLRYSEKGAAAGVRGRMGRESSAPMCCRNGPIAK